MVFVIGVHRGWSSWFGGVRWVDLFVGVVWCDGSNRAVTFKLGRDRHWIYLAAALVLLAVAYILFKKKYYHLHEEYLASLKK